MKTDAERMVLIRQRTAQLQRQARDAREGIRGQGGEQGAEVEAWRQLSGAAAGSSPRPRPVRLRCRRS